MSLNLKSIVVEYLKQNPDKPFTAMEIAKWVSKNYPDECRDKLDRSPKIDNMPDLERQIRREIYRASYTGGLQKEGIKTLEDNPRKFYFTETSDEEEITNVETNKTSIDSKQNNLVVKELDLYPVLSEFLWNQLGLLSTRIDERRSSNLKGVGGNKWLYPDLVGLQDLSDEWHQEIKDCVKQYADKKTKLWSFEVKILINRSNVREAFFQAVSNSSWANFGYLVANKIEGIDTMKELRILSSLHGIGFIRLDIENPTESQIVIPAKERNEIDWDTANRLTNENKDFLEYIKLIRQFYQTGEIRDGDWNINTD